MASDVVIVGGGIVGMTTAYYLARAGVPSVVIERDAIGSHASGFAYGGLSPLSGFGIPGPLAEIAQEGMRLHRELAGSVGEETGIDIDFRVRSSLALAFTDSDARRLQGALSWQQRQPGYTARWVDASEARRIESRISDEALGAVSIEGTADVEPYRLVLALTRASERLGVTVRHGRVTGLRRDGRRVTGVLLERGSLDCSSVVLGLGPWSGEASAWLGVPIEVRPLKGQILRLRAPDPPVACSVGWGHNYATTKPDGLLWAGTTEEEAGFDEETTPAARDEIGAALVRMMPAMADAQLVHQTACLRPLASDGLLLLGRVPGIDGVYMATGGGRKGILFGPAMGRVIADLILSDTTKVALDAFAPGRFAR
ncbi:MAG: FAD-dependent oxidoreductase [Candidatus Rokubacteria bacterium]|nr:FAD-dependent oxidoreductase [Candidatus Rokubacteria bacterium]